MLANAQIMESSSQTFCLQETKISFQTKFVTEKYEHASIKNIS